MHISVNVYYPLFFSYFRESVIRSFIIMITQAPYWENFSIALQSVLSDPVSLFPNFMSFLWNSFFP